MKTKFLGVAATMLGMVIWTMPVSATSFPVATIGETFTGTLTIDPASPLVICCGNPSNFYLYQNVGVMTLNIGGGIFSGPLVNVFVEPGIEWEGSTNGGTFNNTSLPIMVMSIILHGVGSPGTELEFAL